MYSPLLAEQTIMEYNPVGVLFNHALYKIGLIFKYVCLSMTAERQLEVTILVFSFLYVVDQTARLCFIIILTVQYVCARTFKHKLIFLVVLDINLLLNF